MEVKLLDLKRTEKEVEDKIVAAVTKIIREKRFILGSEVKEFEKHFAEYSGVKHALAVASGTAGIHIGLLAAGVKPGDAVVTTPFTFTATGECVVHTTENLRFVDIDPETCCLDIDKLETLCKKQKVDYVMPVHLYGHPVDMDKLLKLQIKYNFKIVEDCAQAHGAQCLVNNEWRNTGTLGSVAAYSFYPTKNLGAYGDAGMVVTDDDEIYEKLLLLFNHGRTMHYEHQLLGYNYRMDTIQAAVLDIKLTQMPKWMEERYKLAGRYNNELQGIEELQLIGQRTWAKTVYHQYVLRTKKRDALLAYLKSKNIGVAVHYPMPLHLQKAYKFLGYKPGDMPVAEQMAGEVLSLPLFPGLTSDEQGYVISEVKSFFACK
ncbi:MAG: DegT/DnrJ/EryC1/StrS family aminotransferase [Elusimicrobiota bacterium]